MPDLGPHADLHPRRLWRHLRRGRRRSLSSSSPTTASSAGSSPISSGGESGGARRALRRSSRGKAGKTPREAARHDRGDARRLASGASGRLFRSRSSPCSAGLFWYALQGGDPSLLPSPLIGKKVPEFTLPAVDGLERRREEVPGFVVVGPRARRADHRQRLRLVVRGMSGRASLAARARPGAGHQALRHRL